MNMSVCPDSAADVVAGYLSGTLDETATREFELHMVDCAACQAALREGAALRTALRNSASGAPARATPSRSIRWVLPVAAALVLAALSLLRDRASPLERLGRVDSPPALAVLSVRGDADSAASLVARGMDSYRSGRYAEAARLFSTADSIAPTEAIAFYRGVSALLGGDPAGGVAVLRRCTRNADDAYAPEAHFYSAKAWLQLAQADSALAHLAESSAGRSPVSTHAAALADSVKAVVR